MSSQTVHTDAWTHVTKLLDRCDILTWLLIFFYWNYWLFYWNYLQLVDWYLCVPSCTTWRWHKLSSTPFLKHWSLFTRSLWGLLSHAGLVFNRQLTANQPILGFSSSLHYELFIGLIPWFLVLFCYWFCAIILLIITAISLADDVDKGIRVI